ncbi:MAG: sulfatase-like hydrolase/transferase [Planctomycetota bacterium]|nr:sulfatase-like hydrolase/transferase [Planctomycetota bacterium]
MLAGCSDELATRRPSVLLVTLDTTRADRSGVYGHEAAETPHIAELASRGLLFERAWAPTPMTLPSHTSMLTGVYPCAHGIHSNGVNRVADQSVLVSEVLVDNGYRTGAFVGSFVLDGKYGLDQGFEHYSAPLAAELSGSSGNRVERPAGEVVDDALAWMAGIEQDEPFFMWVHFNDPHAPFEPPEPYRSRLADPYDGEIANCDAELGRLLAGLAADQRDDDLLIMLTSDHGESLGEYGERTHGMFVYDATMRVPLIVVPPDSGPDSARRVEAPVSVTDIPSTILDVTGVDRSSMPAVQVPSLLAGLNGDGALGTDERSLYIETMVPWDNHRWHPLRGVVWRGHKLIDSSRPELYALPDEQRDLSADQPALLQRFRGRLADVLEQHRPLGWSEHQAVSSSDREQLAALGYTGLAGGTGEPFDPSLPSPRDRVGDLVLIEQAMGLMESSQALLGLDESQRQRGLAGLEQACALLLEFGNRNPGDLRSLPSLAFCQMALGRHALAIEPLEQHVLAVPNSPQTRYNLAVCYLAAGRPDWALSEMAKAIQVEPQADPAYHWIADQHLREGRRGRALWWLQELLRQWKAPPEDVEVLRRRIAEVRAAAQRAGQPVLAPEDFPPIDLTPEGLRLREDG